MLRIVPILMDQESEPMTQETAQRQLIATRCFGMSFRDRKVTLQDLITVFIYWIHISHIDVLRDWCPHLRDLRITDSVSLEVAERVSLMTITDVYPAFSPSDWMDVTHSLCYRRGQVCQGDPDLWTHSEHMCSFPAFSEQPLTLLTPLPVSQVQEMPQTLILTQLTDTLKVIKASQLKLLMDLINHVRSSAIMTLSSPLLSCLSFFPFSFNSFAFLSSASASVTFPSYLYDSALNEQHHLSSGSILMAAEQSSTAFWNSFRQK